MFVSASDKALELMNQTRRRMHEMAELLGAGELGEELTQELSADLRALADQVARAEGLLTTGKDPMGGPYHTQIAALRRWLRAHDHDPEPPIAPALVQAWLVDQGERDAPSSVRESLEAVRAWYQALDLPDPVKALITNVAE